MRGQTSAELLVLLAVVFVIMAFLVSTSFEQLGTSQQQLREQQARATVRDIVKAADAVFSEGVGAKKKVFGTIPDGTVYTNVSGLSVNIRLRSGSGASDINARAKENLTGSLPSVPGGYTIFVTANEGYVQVGPGNLTVVPTILSYDMFTSSSSGKNFTINNIGSPTLTGDIIFTKNWADSNVIATLSDSTYSLGGGASKPVTLSIQATSSALGQYTGTIKVNATNGEEVFVEVIVQVSATGGGGSSNVSYMVVETWKNSSYDTEKLIFQRSQEITIATDGWTPGSTVSFNVWRNSTGTSVYSTTIGTNSTGGASIIFNGAGQTAGDYTVNITQGSKVIQSYFNIGAC